MTVIRCRIFFVHQFGPGNASFSPGLIQEIDNRGTQRKMLVHRPVDTSEGFPASVEIVSIFNVGIRLAEVAEAGPDSEIIRDPVRQALSESPSQYSLWHRSPPPYRL